MIKFLFLLCMLWAVQVQAQNQKIILEIDSQSVRTGANFYEFQLTVTNNSKTPVTMVAPASWTRGVGGYKKSGMMPLGFNHVPYNVTLTSASNCTDAAADGSVNTYVLIKEKELVTISPGEKKAIGEIYVRDSKSCFSLDKSKPYSVSVTYQPNIVKELFTADEKVKIQSAIERLEAASERLKALHVMSILFLPSPTISELKDRFYYEGLVLSRISKISLASNTVTLTR